MRRTGSRPPLERSFPYAPASMEFVFADDGQSIVTTTTYPSCIVGGRYGHPGVTSNRVPVRLWPEPLEFL